MNVELILDNPINIKNIEKFEKLIIEKDKQEELSQKKKKLTKLEPSERKFWGFFYF